MDNTIWLEMEELNWIEQDSYSTKFEKQEDNNMANLYDSAKAYTPQQTGNIADLEAVSLSVPIEQRTGKDQQGKEFSYSVALVTGKEYRVPASVLNDIKTIIEAKPALKTIKVIKKGTGMNTEYTVIPLE